jgi:hypothetical protein
MKVDILQKTFGDEDEDLLRLEGDVGEQLAEILRRRRAIDQTEQPISRGARRIQAAADAAQLDVNLASMSPVPKRTTAEALPVPSAETMFLPPLGKAYVKGKRFASVISRDLDVFTHPSAMVTTLPIRSGAPPIIPSACGIRQQLFRPSLADYPQRLEATAMPSAQLLLRELLQLGETGSVLLAQPGAEETTEIPPASETAPGSKPISNFPVPQTTPPPGSPTSLPLILEDETFGSYFDAEGGLLNDSLPPPSGPELLSSMDNSDSFGQEDKDQEDFRTKDSPLKYSFAQAALQTTTLIRKPSAPRRPAAQLSTYKGPQIPSPRKDLRRRDKSDSESEPASRSPSPSPPQPRTQRRDNLMQSLMHLPQRGPASVLQTVRKSQTASRRDDGHGRHSLATEPGASQPERTQGRESGRVGRGGRGSIQRGGSQRR